MTEDQHGTARSILAGLNYLVQEAENNGVDQIARLLNLCLRDICLLLEGQAAADNYQPSVTATTDLFMAIRFLSRYAAISDQQLRKDILEELEQLEGPGLRRRGTDA